MNRKTCSKAFCGGGKRPSGFDCRMPVSRPRRRTCWRPRRQGDDPLDRGRRSTWWRRRSSGSSSARLTPPRGVEQPRFSSEGRGLWGSPAPRSGSRSQALRSTHEASALAESASLFISLLEHDEGRDAVQPAPEELWDADVNQFAFVAECRVRADLHHYPFSDPD